MPFWILKHWYWCEACGWMDQQKNYRTEPKRCPKCLALPAATDITGSSDSISSADGMENAPVNVEDLDEWIEKNIRGRGRAVRRQDEPALPDEPYMSMREAESLIRKAFAHFTRLH